MSSLQMVDTGLIKQGIRDVEDLKAFLSSLSQFDADFTGDNGEEYLWEVAKAEGYECNMDYLIDKVIKDCEEKGITNVAKIVERYAEAWERSDHYYDSISMQVVQVTEGYTDLSPAIYVGIAIATFYN